MAIARALFAVTHGASLLVRDEPAASLDVPAEAAFYREFLTLTRNVTTVLVSHRLQHFYNLALTREVGSSTLTTALYWHRRGIPSCVLPWHELPASS